MTLGSLFDGIGGWQLAAVRNNIKPIWSSEINKFCLAVTRERFPETQQLGDVNQIDGGNFVWENVVGALTSNGGLDFKTVLEEIAETEIPMPEFGRWAGAGMVRGGKCAIYWRILDAQYFGVPQRRRRIFLIADFTGRSTSEILFERENASRNFAPRKVEKFSPAEMYLGVSSNSSSGTEIEMTACLVCSHNIFAVSRTESHKLTPLECERLQGLPDNWTLIDNKLCTDTARWKAISNGMAQPCADWILSRIVRFGDSTAVE